MFSSFMHLNHQMNIPADDLFMRGIQIIQHPFILCNSARQAIALDLRVGLHGLLCYLPLRLPEWRRLS